MSGRRNTLNAQRGPTPAAAGTKTATLPAKSQVFSQGQRAPSKGLWRESVESTSTSDSTRQTGSGISEMARMKRRRMDSEIWRITLLRDCGEFRLNPEKYFWVLEDEMASFLCQYRKMDLGLFWCSSGAGIVYAWSRTSEWRDVFKLKKMWNIQGFL